MEIFDKELEPRTMTLWTVKVLRVWCLDSIRLTETPLGNLRWPPLSDPSWKLEMTTTFRPLLETWDDHHSPTPLGNLRWPLLSDDDVLSRLFIIYLFFIYIFIYTIPYVYLCFWITGRIVKHWWNHTKWTGLSKSFGETISFTTFRFRHRCRQHGRYW